MNYYYDVYLNFLDDNYMFYEWENTDNIEYFKKVPLFQVSGKTLKDFLNNQVRVNRDFLELIKNKAKKKNEYSKYIALFADKNGVIALEFNDDGNSIARSFLDIDDELNLLDILYTMRVENIDYMIVKSIPYHSNLRMEDKIKLFINTEVNSLKEKENYAKLKYLFLEWFNEEPKNNEEIITKMTEAINHKIGPNELKIYNLIKLSYSNV